MKALKRAWLEISFDRLRYNYRQIQDMVGSGVKIMAVLKADGYGCGDAVLARELERLDHTVQFAVSNLNEAVRLRDAGIEGPVLILGYTPLENLDTLLQYDVTQTLVSYEYACRLRERLAERDPLKAHIKLDSGMGRLGIACFGEDTAVFERQVTDICASPCFHIMGCYTHIATFYENDSDSDEYSRLQYSRFLEFTNRVGQTVDLGLRHCLNSAGIANKTWMHLDMVRPGTLLYGALPDRYNHSGRKFCPIVQIKACVSKVSHIPAGTYVGYSRAFQAEREMDIAILTIGYSDVLRMGSGKGAVIINDVLCPVIGGVCMDQMAVDISNAGKVCPEDTAIILGRSGHAEIGFTQMAEFLDCGEEEIYCHITGRPDRIYL